MSEDLQSLLEKINREGVEKARAEADKIIADAKAKAADIVKTANAEAAKVVIAENRNAVAAMLDALMSRFLVSDVFTALIIPKNAVAALTYGQ